MTPEPMPDGYESRSRERYRRASGGLLSAVMARAVTAGISLATIPITLPFLGAERFGAWMTVVSFTALAGFADLGVGLALMNSIAAAEGREDSEAQGRLFTNAIAIASVIAAVAGLLVIVAGATANWAEVLNIDDPQAAAEIGPSLLIVAVMFFVGLPLGMASGVWNGIQRTYVPNTLSALGSLVGFLGILISVGLGLGIPAFTAASAGGPVVASLIGFGLLFRARPLLRPRPRWLSSIEMKTLLAAGISFLVLQAAIAVASGSNVLVLATVVGQPAVAQYAVLNRIFAIPLGLAVALVMVIWPALREAATRGDREWVRRTFVGVLVGSVLAVVPFSIVALMFGTRILSALTAGRIEADVLLLTAFAASTLVWAVANSLSVLLNSASIVWPQAVPWVAMAVTNIILSVFLAARIGTSGVVWGSALTVGLMILPLSWLVLHRSGLRRTATAAARGQRA